MSAIAPKWISGQKILSRWDIRDFELLGIVKKGIQPYSSDLGKPVFPHTMQKKRFLQKAKGSKKGLELKLEVLRKSRLPGEKFDFIPHKELKEIEDEIEEAKKLRGAKMLRKPRLLSFTNYIPHKELEEIELDLINEIEETKKLIEDSREKLSKESGDWADYTPRSQEEERRIIKELLTHIYKEEEVNRLAGPANRKNIPSARTTLDSKSIRPPSTRKAIPAPEKQADDSIPVISFYKKDDYWQIGKEGNEAHLKSLKGYELIQFLIKKESESFDPNTLYYKGNVPEELEGLKSGTSSQEKYDIKTLGSVNKQIEVLTEKLKETSDREKKEEIQEKIKKVATYLKHSNYLFSEFDRSKHNVRELINRAIKKLHEEAEKKPALSPLKKYLTNKGTKKTIIIGSESYYKPNPSDPVKWKLDSN